MRPIYFLSICILILSLSDVWGQGARSEDKVTLKDGQVIFGWILENEANQPLKIELVGGSVLILEDERIESIERVPSRFERVDRVYNYQRSPLMYRDKGAFAYVASNFAFRDGTWGQRLEVGLHVRVGHKINRYLGLGAGVGIDNYEGAVYMPLYLDVHGDFLRKKVTPHYQVSAGYSYGINPRWPNSDIKGGFMGFMGFGYKIRTRTRLEWIIVGGYKIQEAVETERSFSGQGGDIVKNVNRQGITIQFGVGF